MVIRVFLAFRGSKGRKETVVYPDYQELMEKYLEWVKKA